MATDDEIIYKLMVNLPSPCVGEVDPLGFYDDLFAPLRRNGPIEGMVTPLYQYQRAAVARMLHQELYPPGYVPTLGKLPMDTYPPELRSEPISCSYGCGKHHYSPAVNPLTKDMKTSTDTTTVRTRGGILAEDPRSGKTLELLTLILLTKDQLAYVWISEIKKHMAPGTLKYVTIQIPDSLVLDSEGDDPNQTRFSRKNFRGKSVTLSTYNLGQYFNGYLSIPPFNFGDLWGNVGMHLEEHPRRHNVSSLLNWVLTTYVVRNRSEDVRREIAIPPLTKRGYNKMKNVLEQPKKFGLNRIGTDLFRQCLRCIDLDLCDPTYRFNRNWFRTNYYIDIWPRSSFVFDTVSKKRKLLHGKLPDNDKTDMRPETENSLSDLSSNSTAILVDENGLKVLANQLQLRHFHKHSDNVPPDADTMSSMLIDGESSIVMADDILLADSNPGLPDTNFESHRVVRPLAILGCSSTKMTYLANQLRLYSPYEKSVVYVNSKVDMKAVPAFLNLIGIKSVTLSHNVWYDCSHSGFWLPERDVYRPSYKNVVEFITNADCRVLVLPAWMAISGIDLTVASRIYFFSPVWYNTIEAEAIRRVHHMGQTRAVHVETLVIRDTVEEVAFNFKGKPLYDGYRSSCKRKTNDNATDMDDLSNQDVDLSYNQEESPIDKTEDAKETADDTSPTQSTSGSANHRLGPDIFFDEPIPLLSLRI
ncbi:hypothetical protein IWQ62_004445 [Dispira parvispora]|uniref:Helicase C-terminal domain-containing protein n=1 Tax=Dispira parvispora TaxID=1520584 RepID=A0A9W8E1Y9_9FUNG|nr:hypothetical protein IWQ62_004445 [Dispira parvispora]